MTATQTEIQSRVIGLSAEAFETFCNDVSGMFGVSMKCVQQDSCTDTIDSLKKHFQELTAVTLIQAKGVLNGTLQLLFDQQGLFILGNLMTMPERMASFLEKAVGSQKIAENIKSGSLKEAKEMSDAVAEVGNLMVGSWDRVFRKELDKHEHFKQISTFIGNLWDKPEQDVGLASDEELLFVLYKMTAGSYPAFTCGAIFPKAVFSDAETEEKIRAEARAKVLAEAGEKARAEAEEKAKAKAKEKPSEAETRARIEAEERAKVEAEMKAKAQAEEKTNDEDGITCSAETKEIPLHQSTGENNVTQEENAEKQVSETASEQTGPVTGEKPNVSNTEEAERAGEYSARKTFVEPAASETHAEKVVETDKADSVDDQKAFTQNCKLKKPAVSEFIQKMIQSPAVLPGESDQMSLAICAQDIMRKDVVWSSGDDSIQQVLTKMQQAETAYILVGTDERLEGIISKSDITGAVSIYLRPIFAKWRRPVDDATLQIRVKWIMTRPVRTIRPETSLAQIMDNICRFSQRALPVVDQQGKVRGLVTVFDIFQAFLSGSANISCTGKPRQSPPLTQLDLLVGREA